jgi:uncharacterized repeat protein (TIGR03803 family)
VNRTDFWQEDIEICVNIPLSPAFFAVTLTILFNNHREDYMYRETISSARGVLLRGICVLILTCIGCGFATAQSEQVLYSFQGDYGSGDGSHPEAPVIFDSSGNLYSTTNVGDSQNEGTVFELSSNGGSWNETQLFGFEHTCNGVENFCTGILPTTPLVFDTAGNLYGTTYEGGPDGWGTVFELIRPVVANNPWTEVILHNFTGASDGGIPEGGLLIDSQGNLYGVAGEGGILSDCAMGCGTVFKLTPSGSSWTFRVLHSFTGTNVNGDGNAPVGELVRDSANNLYGVTSFGGQYNQGSVFRISLGSTITESVLYSFQGGSADGSEPLAGVIRNSSNTLYGTTAGGGTGSCIGIGCGIVYQISPPSVNGGAWTETVLHNFTGGTDGRSPFDRLVLDSGGDLYGTAGAGGSASCDCGVVFKLVPAPAGGWVEVVLYAFAGAPDGAGPEAGVTLKNNVIYGTTYAGGTGVNGGQGTVFSITP